MLLPMLKAVRNMIYIPISPEIRADIVHAKIECATEILDEIIKSLEINPPNDIIQVPIPPITTVIERKNSQPLKVDDRPTVIVDPNKVNDKEYMVTIDENRGLKIIDFPLDGDLEVDGKKVKYSDAQGKLFKTARIL